MIGKVVADHYCASPADVSVCQQSQMTFHSIFACQSFVFCIAYIVSGDSETYKRISLSFFRRSLSRRRKRVHFDQHSHIIYRKSFEILEIDSNGALVRRLATDDYGDGDGDDGTFPDNPEDSPKLPHLDLLPSSSHADLDCETISPSTAYALLEDRD